MPNRRTRFARERKDSVNAPASWPLLVTPEPQATAERRSRKRCPSGRTQPGRTPLERWPSAKTQSGRIQKVQLEQLEHSEHRIHQLHEIREIQESHASP